MVLVGLVLLPAAPANAGGAWMEPGRRGYGVGETATFRGSFSMSGSLEGRLSDGPYVAYLAPVEIYDVDHPFAIRLGEIEMVRSERWGVIATIAFTVPDVPTGQYQVTYCNEPCTVDGVGDLMGGKAFYVAPTREEALLRARVDSLTWRLADTRQDGRRQERLATERLERSLAAEARELALAREEIATLEARVAELRPASARREPVVPGWAVIAAAVVLAFGIGTGATIVRRRREPSFVVPDTIPDELDLRESAAGANAVSGPVGTTERSETAARSARVSI
jgi:hypothetical protein